MPASTASSTRTGAVNRDPPCTTRTPMASGRGGSSISAAAGNSKARRFIDELPGLSARIFTSERPAPVADRRQVVAALADVFAVIDQQIAHGLLHVRVARQQPRHAVDHVHDQVTAVEIVEHRHVEGRGRRPLLFVSADVEVLVVRAPVGQAVNEPRVAVEGKDDRLVPREESVEVRVGESVRVVGGCWVDGCSFIRSTTSPTRTFNPGRRSRRIAAAARVSSVGTSPAQAMTTSGSASWSLLAHRPMPAPAVQCFPAWSMSRYCNAGCLPATITLT